MSYECEIKEMTAQPALAIRTVASTKELPHVLGQAYGAIGRYLAELGEEPAGAPYAAYFNMDVEKLDVEVGMPVSRPLPGRDNIKPSELPGGRVATCLYKGPYSQIEPAYDGLNTFVAEHGLATTGAAYEQFLDDPAHTAPGALRTLILFPLREK